MPSPGDLDDQLEQLFQLVHDDPARAVAVAGDLIERAEAGGDHRTAAIGLRGRGLAHDYLTEGTAAVTDLERALDHARRSEDDEILGQVQMTRAGVLVHAGHHQAATPAIDDAIVLLSGDLLARAMVQRGAMRTAVGDLDAALSDFAAAEPILRRTGDDLWLAHLADNRAIVLGYQGAYGAAQQQFEAARRRYAALGHRQAVAEVAENLGWLAAHSGDLVAAFRHFDQAEEEFRAIGSGLGYLWIHRCWALLACHLAAEARVLAGRAAKELTRAGYGLAGAEAMAMQAEAALLDGADEEALEVARAARDVFEHQARPAWAAYATHLALRARSALGDLRREDLDAVRGVAVALEAAGMRDLALHARLLGGRTALRLGDADGGAADLGLASRARSTGTADLRVQAWLATALLRLELGNRRGAARAVHAGIAIADRYGAALGALEARAGISAHTEELAGLGLRLALDGGRPHRIFEWMERSRARALDFPSVVPPEDSDLAALLSRLRLTDEELRNAELGGDETARLRRESSDLQEQIRRLNLRTGSEATLVSRTGLAASIRGRLDGGCLLELAVDGGDIHAVVLRGNRVTHHRIGRLDDALRALDDLRFGLDRLSRPGGSEASRASAHLMAEDAAATVARAVLPESFAPGPGTEVVVVPPAELFPVPWSLLPPLRGLRLSVAPAARLWLRRAGKLGVGGRAVLIGGPMVPGAAAETLRVSRLYGEVTRFTARNSKVDDVLAALDGSCVAHLVAHGNFRSDNPLFSSLQLADGGLTVYDLARVRRLPPLIVLSACNAGITASRPGNETMGIVAGLLDAGVRCVVASTGLVADTALTTDTMVGFHRLLVEGRSPAAALAEVQAWTVDRGPGHGAASFVCFGAG